MLLLLSSATSASLVIFPLAIIQPFRRQSPIALQRALHVFSIAPPVTLTLAALAIFATIGLWTKVRLFPRIVCAILLMVGLLAAGFSRLNVFEQMFHPAGSPQFFSIKESKIDEDDMVIAVALNGDAHSYPIREIAYHHVVNDWIGGVPIVATY